MAIGVRLVVALVLALVVGSAWGQSSPPVGAILTLLRAGGYVIVVRHGATHADQADTDPLNLDNVAKQRQLNDKGRADSKAVGDAFKAAGVPIGKSISSRFYRAVETAQLIGGKAPEPTLDVSEGGLVAGRNTLVVTHKPNILDAFGKDWFEIREGEASIFKPDGKGSYTLIARVPIDQWAAVKK